MFHRLEFAVGLHEPPSHFPDEIGFGYVGSIRLLVESPVTLNVRG
jgi:hypothetical protein